MGELVENLCYNKEYIKVITCQKNKEACVLWFLPFFFSILVIKRGFRLMQQLQTKYSRIDDFVTLQKIHKLSLQELVGLLHFFN